MSLRKTNRRLISLTYQQTITKVTPTRILPTFAIFWCLRTTYNVWPGPMNHNVPITLHLLRRRKVNRKSRTRETRTMRPHTNCKAQSNSTKTSAHCPPRHETNHKHDVTQSFELPQIYYPKEPAAPSNHVDAWHQQPPSKPLITPNYPRNPGEPQINSLAAATLQTSSQVSHHTNVITLALYLCYNYITTFQITNKVCGI